MSLVTQAGLMECPDEPWSGHSPLQKKINAETFRAHFTDRTLRVEFPAESWLEKSLKVYRYSMIGSTIFRETLSLESSTCTCV